MTSLLELKEKVIRFYGKNEAYIAPLMKFIIAFLIFVFINTNIGYMKSISKLPIALILALVCSVLPMNGTIFLASVVILADMYALSLEVALVTLLLFAVVYFLYFRFAPKNGGDVLMTVLCFKLRIPYLIPVGMGLLREMYSVFAMFCGIVLYHFLGGVKDNAAVLSGAVEEDAAATSKFVVALNQLIGNKEMLLSLAVMCGTMLVVHLIRKMSIANAWMIAIVAGIIVQTIGMIAGYIMLDISGRTVGVLIGSAVSCVLAFLVQFLCFNLDYSRTERLQFEDDEYYYYVKAVPKAFVSGSEKKIKRFGGTNEKEERLTKKRFAEEMDIDEELLD